MNLAWNSELRRFEVEFHDFEDEQPRVKAVGFKTDGPPAWVWYSLKSEPLTKLKENKPATLTISPEARAEYSRLHVVELRNAEVKAQAKAAAKELKKKLKGDKADAMKPNEYLDEETGLICYQVKLKEKPYVSPMKIAAPPEEKCVVCQHPIYAYEYEAGAPQICLWCQKIVVDTGEELC